MIKISIQGSRGSFHDIVARDRFPGDSEIVESDTYHQVFEDLKRGFVNYGVVAIENSIYGSFRENYDLLLKHDVKIVGEKYHKVILDLIALPGVKLKDLSEVYTHPMAMIQAEAFLEKYPNLQRIETHDTAYSVSMIKEKNLVHAAAIGSKLAAEIYGMNVLAHDIETEQHNYTRFLFLANEDYYVDNPDKTSIVIKVRDEPGSLYRCLKAFFNESINLSKLESRQLVGSFDYYFYIDFKKGLRDDETRRAISQLKKATKLIKILGTYKEGSIKDMR